MVQITGISQLINFIKNSVSTYEIVAALDSLSQANLSHGDVRYLLPVIYNLQSDLNFAYVDKNEIVEKINQTYFRLASRIGCN
ncbi:MAG: hypothetical protein ABII22_03090 [Candidatus Micrarchaeota archaeon]